MRLWIVLGVIGAAILILVVAQNVTTSHRGESARQSSSTNNAAPALTVARTVSSARPHVTQVTAEERESQIQQDLKAIEGVMLQTGERTLPLLCEKLASSEARVRHSALTNLVVLADREALPALAEALNRSADPEEKVEIQKAIDFLQLPTYDELVANGTLPAPNKMSVTAKRLEAEKIHIGTNPTIQKVEN